MRCAAFKRNIFNAVVCSGISYSSCMLSGRITIITAGTSDAAASALSQHCSSACSATYVLLPDQQVLLSHLFWNTIPWISRNAICNQTFSLCVSSAVSRTFQQPCHLLPGRSRALFLHENEKPFLGNCSTTNDVPWSQSGKGQRPKPRQEGKGRQQSSLFLCEFSTSKTQRIDSDEAGGGRRRRREGEPSAGHRHAQRKRKGHSIDPDFYFKDRENPLVGRFLCSAISWSYQLFWTDSTRFQVLRPLEKESPHFPTSPGQVAGASNFRREFIFLCIN